MIKDNKIMINVTLKNKKGKHVKAVIIVDDGFALMKSEDKMLAYQLYDLEKNKGNTNVSYNSKLNVYIEKYPGMSSKEIAKKIKKELESQQ